MTIAKQLFRTVSRSVLLKKQLIWSKPSSASLSTEINFSQAPKRSILYVPGNDSKKLTKIYDTNADCVVLDCEDGVALNRKQEARENLRKLFSTDKRVQNDQDLKYAVRINPAPSELAQRDIDVIFDPALSSQQLPKCVFVPKTNLPDDIKWLYEKLYNNLKNVKDLNQSLSLFFYMESAISLLNLRSIIEIALDLNSSKYRSMFKLDGFVFGSDDYCADISATRTKDASELVYARQKLVSVCKAYKLQAIDMVYIDFKDLEGLKNQSEQGARMGFTGKQVIHPGQVDVTQQAYTPSKEKIDWALGLVEAFNEHQNSGAGAFTYKGQMIDMPSLLQAKNVLAIANRVIRSSK